MQNYDNILMKLIIKILIYLPECLYSFMTNCNKNIFITNI